MFHGQGSRSKALPLLIDTLQGYAPSRRAVLRLAALSAAAALVGEETAAGAPQQRETRAIFDEDFSWLTREQAELVVSRIKAAGFNVFVPCIWQGQGTWWPSQHAPWCEHPLAEVFRRESFDTVANLIEVARSKEVDVLLWMNVMHAGWGKLIRPEFRTDDTPVHFYDVHNADFRKWIGDIMMEASDRYSHAAGLCLDYLRSGGGGWTQPSWHLRYAAERGRMMMFDLDLPSDQSNIIDWHAAACTEILERVRKSVYSGSNGRTIGVCASSDESDDLLQGRTVRAWADRRLVDIAYWMDYADSPNFERALAVRAKMARPESLVMLCGNYSKADDGRMQPKNAEIVARNLQESRRMLPGGGTALYLYKTLTDEQIGVLRAKVFNEPAAPSWRSSATP